MLSSSRFKILIILSLFAGLAACTKSADPARVTFNIPTLRALSSSPTAMTSSTSEDSRWGYAAPTSASQIGCYAIFIGGPESEFQRMSCTTSANTQVKFGFFAGLVSPGATASITVPAGADRTFTLVGLATATGATCDALPELDGSKYSKPVLLGSTTMSLVAGDNELALNGAISSTTLDSCNFGTSGPSAGAIYLGTGFDGDVTVSGGSSISTTMNQSNTRKLSTTARVLELAPTGQTDEYRVKLEGSGYSAMNYGLGDEVMFYIAGDGNQSSCGNLFGGFRVQGLVTGAAGYDVVLASYTLNAKFSDPRIATVPNAALVAPADVGTNFCRATVVRVPNLKTLTFNSGSLSVGALGSLTGANQVGGVLPIRVRDGIRAQSGTNYINATGSGYSAGGTFRYPGDGLLGAGTIMSTTANGNGGGGAMSGQGAGGGGNAGAGLVAQNSVPADIVGSGGGTVGDEYGCGSSDPLKRCLFGKIFLGGGAGINSPPGASVGSGGGAVLVFTSKIEVDSGATLGFKAMGTAGDGSSAGGGAGGSILLRTLVIQSAGTLTFIANGGNGGSNDYGSGGGGRVHVDVINDCVTTIPATVNVNGGTSGVRAGYVGTFYKTGTAVTRGTCLLPP